MTTGRDGDEATVLSIIVTVLRRGATAGPPGLSICVISTGGAYDA